MRFAKIFCATRIQIPRCVLIFVAFCGMILLKRGVIVIKFRLKVLLAMNDMTQKDLAEKTGIRQPTISAICTGSIKEMPVGVVNKICAALYCQPGDIMEYIPDEE